MVGEGLEYAGRDRAEGRKGQLRTDGPSLKRPAGHTKTGAMRRRAASGESVHCPVESKGEGGRRTMSEVEGVVVGSRWQRASPNRPELRQRHRYSKHPKNSSETAWTDGRPSPPLSSPRPCRRTRRPTEAPREEAQRPLTAGRTSSASKTGSSQRSPTYVPSFNSCPSANRAD